MPRNTKERLASALRQIAAVKSLDRITVKEIAERSGLTIATFYNHFRDKYDLAAWVSTNRNRAVLEEAAAQGLGLYELWLSNLQYARENREYLINALENSHGKNSFALKCTENAISTAEPLLCQANDWTSTPQPVLQAMRLYSYGSILLVYNWMVSDCREPEPELARLLTDSLPGNLAPLLSKNRG